MREQRRNMEGSENGRITARLTCAVTSIVVSRLSPAGAAPSDMAQGSPLKLRRTLRAKKACSTPH